MEYIYAALLLHKQGKPVDENSLKKVITATGSEVNESKVKVLIESLKNVDIDKELENAAIASTHAPAASAPAEKKEDKKEEKASAAAEGLSSLFG